MTEKKNMIEQLFFDADCLSSFLWVGQENLLLQLYPGRIVLPKQVYDELSHPSIRHIGAKIEMLHRTDKIIRSDILLNTEEYKIYHDLAISPPQGQRLIGKGEAAALALAKVNNGIVASNNLKDIMGYVGKFGLEHITTGDIMILALQEGLIDENHGNQIWQDMVQRRRLLPTASFTEFLSNR